LPASQAQQLLAWLLKWTGGHPYLTQRLCVTLLQEPKPLTQGLSRGTRESEVDQVVMRTFFGPKSEQDSNLRFVRDMLTKRAPNKSAVLSTYRKIRRGRTVRPDGLIQSHLKLSGIVYPEGNKLRVRNRIYEEVFDQPWIKEQLPKSRWQMLPTSVKIASVMMIVIFVALLFSLRTALPFQQERSAIPQIANLPTSSTTANEIVEAAPPWPTPLPTFTLGPLPTRAGTRGIEASEAAPPATEAVSPAATQAAQMQPTRVPPTQAPLFANTPFVPSSTQAPQPTQAPLPTQPPPTQAPTTQGPLPTVTAFARYSVGPVAVSPKETTINSDVVRFEWQWNGRSLQPGHSFALVGFRDGEYLRLATVDGSQRRIDVEMRAHGNFETVWEWYVVVVDEAGNQVSPRSAALRFGISLHGGAGDPL